jgi:hypothetical protein
MAATVSPPSDWPAIAIWRGLMSPAKRPCLALLSRSMLVIS